MSALSKEVPEAAASTTTTTERLSERASRSTRPSTRPRDGDIREQRPDAGAGRDSCGESHRLSFGGSALQRQKRNTEQDRVHTQALSESGLEQDCDDAQNLEEEESGAGQSSKPRTACEVAC